MSKPLRPIAYYNEIDPFAAAWLRGLIKQGHIADGIVDERSIEDVTPADLGGFTQCHFFAGIGVWSYALRRAGWPDDRPVWTGSCPCQPFSAAGKGAGFADERHLWPAFHWLIQQCRPECILGEQVAGKAGETWLDLVSTDLEMEGYAVGAAVTAACGFGAPHQRKRLYWVADSRMYGHAAAENRSGIGTLQEEGWLFQFAGACASDELGDTELLRRDQGITGDPGEAESQRRERRHELDRSGAVSRGPCPTNGFWRDADWLFCRDGKWRPVEPGTFPLAHGSAARVGRLRGYGNAIVAQQAQAWIEAVMRDCA